MIRFLIGRGTVLAVAVLVVCVLGLTAALRLPVQMIPDLDVRMITVVTGWPGATPQDVEKEILFEQERYLRNLPQLRRMVSNASTGQAVINLEFPFGVDINEALVRTGNALSRVPSYPENVDQPQLFSSSSSDAAFLYFALSPVAGNPLGLNMDLAMDFVEDHVRPRMERVEGVSQVGVGGGAERQIHVHADPGRLAQRGLSLADLRDAIRQRNRDISAGDVDDGKRRYLLRTVGRFERMEDLDALIVHRHGDTEVRLENVAATRLGHSEIRSMAFNDGERRITLSVRREPGANVIGIKRAMLDVVAEINRDTLLPNGMEMRMWSDDVRYVTASIKSVWINLMLGALLATAVMFGFLRSWRATLIGVLGIPLCTIAAFMGLMWFGRTLNVISLAGIAFALGMTLDNSIVVLESIEQARRSGLARWQAALSGVQKVWPAVLAATATTVLVFVPVLFLREEAGQLYSDVAIAISMAIVASMLVAVVIVPAVLARAGFGGQSARSSGHRIHTRVLSIVGSMLVSPAWRTGTVLVVLSTALLTVMLLIPPAEYLPEGEEPKAFTSMIAPPGYNLEAMSAIAQEVQQWLMPALNADPALFRRGEAELPSLKYASVSVSTGRLSVMSEPTRHRDLDAMMQTLSEHFRSYPGMRAFSTRGSIISSNDGGSRAVNLDISGARLEDLYAVADTAYRRAVALFPDAQISSSPSSLSLDQPIIEIRPRWERLSENGLGVAEFGFAVAALSDGAYVDEFFMGDDKLDIFLFGDRGRGQSLDGLAQAPVVTSGGVVLPLNALADLVENVATDTIRRVDGRRTVTLSIVPPRNVALETAMDRVRGTLIPAMRAAGEIPAAVSVGLSGASDQLENTRKQLGSNFLIAIVLSYLVMVAIFSHWGWPLLIMTTVPIGMAGGVVGLALFNASGEVLTRLGLAGFAQPFDMITMLGFLILLGAVVNNPILIVDRTRRNLDDGLEAIGAVHDAVASRLRPILMSTLTTVVGIMPLVLIPGAGTELYRGIGVIVISGLLFSTVVTLTFLPVLLVILLQLRSRLVKA